jgi:arylsulfatase A
MAERSHTRRVALRAAITFATLSLAACTQPRHRAPARPPHERPNIVFIMVDDLGAECVGCYGGQSYNTPNLDKLAQSGIRFDNAYCTPLCTPTRVEVMTGQYPVHNGWPGGIWNKPRERQFLDPSTFTFARLLKNAGYATAVAGKWQLARFEDRPQHPRNLGFDQHCLWTWTYTGPAPEYTFTEGKRPGRYWNPGLWVNGRIMPDTKDRFGPDICTDFLLEFIENHANRPFFAYYPMLLTHSPFVAAPGTEDRLADMSKQERFVTMVEYMDTLVGRIVTRLEQLGLRENTLLIVTGDNGTDHRITSDIDGRRLQGGKATMTDAGTRVPFIVHWPGTAAPRRVINDLVDFTDILPTFAEVAGARVPEQHRLDGKSLLPRIQGQPYEPRQWVLCQKGGKWFLRTHDWRLHENGDLYRMRAHYDPEPADPNENPDATRAKTELLAVAESLGLECTGSAAPKASE